MQKLLVVGGNGYLGESDADLDRDVEGSHSLSI